VNRINLKKYFLKQFRQLPKNLQEKPLFFALSGGRDSTVLAHVALSIKGELPPLHFVHVNYHLRVPDSDREEAFLAHWAKTQGIEFHVKRFYPKSKPRNLQEWARERRYRFFSECIRKHSGGKGLLCLGHHQRDQVETILERMIQGTGLKSWGGMDVLRDFEDRKTLKLKCPLKVFRPFLELPFGAIQSYAQHHRLKFYQDLSNLKPLYLRNRIRLKILPLLENENPQIQRSLTRLAQQGREAHLDLEGRARNWLKRQGRVHGSSRKISRLSLIKFSPARTRVVLEQWIRNFMPEHRSLGKLIDTLQELLGEKGKEGEVRLSPPLLIKVEKEFLRLTLRNKKKKNDDNFKNISKLPENKAYWVREAGQHTFPELKQILEVTPLKNFSREAVLDSPRSKNLAYIDGQSLLFPLRLSKAQNGLRFVPLGMRGSKSLRRFLMDQKVPRKKRQPWVLYNAKNMPIWILGFRLDDRAKVRRQSQEVYRLRLRRIQKPKS